jgi:hypothetical protein
LTVFYSHTLTPWGARVPTIVSDLVEFAMADSPLDSLIFGGSPVNNRLPEMARKAYPNAFLSAFVDLCYLPTHVGYSEVKRTV